MQRRTLLKLGIASACLVAAGGGTLALWRPGLEGGRLAPPGRVVLAAVGGALLDGALPVAEPERASALADLLERVDTLVMALPASTAAELSQLLALLHSGPGRRILAGLVPHWERASVAQVQAALTGLRHSRVHLRRQVYQGLHEIVTVAWLASPQTWSLLGYPGPASSVA